MAGYGFWTHYTFGTDYLVELGEAGEIVAHLGPLADTDLRAEVLADPDNYDLGYEWASGPPWTPEQAEEYVLRQPPYIGDQLAKDRTIDDLYNRRIYGIAEIAEALGARRQTVAQWHRRGQLPPPTEQLAAGPVWAAATIEPWISARKNR